MIVLRRAIALALVPIASTAFIVALIAGRVDATVLDGGFLLDHAEDAGLFTLVHEEGIPAFVDGFVDRQEEELPENLRNANLPTDTEARARMAEVVQTLLPPELIRDLADVAVGGVLPYMVGKQDHFEKRISLHDSLVATFGKEPGERSVFEAAWLDLDVSERLIRGFSEVMVEEEAAAGGSPPSAGEEGLPTGPPEGPQEDLLEQGLLQLLAQDIEGAADWWDQQFLGFIEGLLPFMAGDSDELDLHIDFTDYPVLAHAFAEPLQTDARTLQTDGWRFTDEDLRRRLAESQDLTMEDVDRQLAVFHVEGLTFDDGDLTRWLDERREAVQDGAGADSDDVPPDLQVFRERIRITRIALTWGATALAVALFSTITFLGGREWIGRLTWGSTTLLVASTLALIMAVPVWAATGSGRVDEALDDLRAAEDSNIPLVVRERLAEGALNAVHDFVAGVQWRAAAWLILAAVALALAVASRNRGFRARVRSTFARPRDGATGSA